LFCKEKRAIIVEKKEGREGRGGKPAEYISPFVQRREKGEKKRLKIRNKKKRRGGRGPIDALLVAPKGGGGILNRERNKKKKGRNKNHTQLQITSFLDSTASMAKEKKEGRILYLQKIGGKGKRRGKGIIVFDTGRY